MEEKGKCERDKRDDIGPARETERERQEKCEVSRRWLHTRVVQLIVVVCCLVCVPQPAHAEPAAAAAISRGSSLSRFLRASHGFGDGIRVLRVMKGAIRRLTGVDPSNTFATIADACKDRDAEECRKLYIKETERICGEDVDLASNDLAFHSTAGALGFLNGFDLIAGNPNRIDKLYLGGGSLFSASKDFWTDYLVEIWFWYIWLGLALGLGIFMFSWSIALCARNCRKCYGSCFCNNCCNERDRRRPIYEVRKKRHDCIMGWFITFPLIWSFIFIAVAITYGVFFGIGLNRSVCSMWRVHYVTLFGDTGFTSDVTYAGVMGAEAKILEMGSGFDGVYADLNTTADYLNKETADTIDDGEAQLKKWKDALKTTTTNLEKDKSYDYFSSGTIGLTSHQECFACKTYAANEINIAQVKTRYVEIKDGTAEGVTMGLQKDVFEPVLRELPSLANETLGLDGFAQQTLEFLDHITDNDEILGYLSYGALGLFIAVPAVILELWIASIVLYACLRKSYAERKEVRVKKYRDWFACLCFFFGFFTFILLLVGFFALTAVQPAAEGCHLIEYNLFRDNEYWNYPLFRNLTTDSLPNVTQNCMTYEANGELLNGTSLDVVSLQNMTTLGAAVRSVADEAFIAVELATNMTKLNYTDAIHEDIQQGGFWVFTTTDATIRDTKSRFYALYRESLFGGLQDTDIPMDMMMTSRMNATIESIRETAEKAIEQTEFYFNEVAQNNGKQMPKTRYENEIENPYAICGMNKQLARLNTALREIGCPEAAVCLGKSCVCGSAADCVQITGTKNLEILPIDKKNKLRLIETLESPKNDDGANLNKVLTCIKDIVEKDGTKIPDAVLFLGSFFLTALRAKSKAEDVFFNMPNITSSITRNEVKYELFVNRVEHNWNVVYEMSTFKSAFEPPIQNITVSADETDSIYNKTNSELDCSLQFNRMEAGADFLCQQLIADLGFTGLWWVLLAIGMFVGMILSWRIFHYFADLEAENQDDWKNRDQLRRPSLLLQQCKAGDLREVQKCCKFQNPTAASDEAGNGCLHIAAYHDHPGVCRYLLDKKCDPAEKNRLGYTPVEVATSGGHIRTVQVLVRDAKALRSVDPWGDMPVHTAAREGDLAVLYALLPAEEQLRDKGAPKNMDGETPQAAAARMDEYSVRGLLDDFYSGRISAQPRPSASSSTVTEPL